MEAIGESKAKTEKTSRPKQKQNTNSGKQGAPQPEKQRNATEQTFVEYASYLYDNENTVEVWGVVAADLASIDVTAGNDPQSLELDSGDWFLVRIKPLPPSDSLKGIIRVKRRGQG